MATGARGRENFRNPDAGEGRDDDTIDCYMAIPPSLFIAPSPWILIQPVLANAREAMLNELDKDK